MKYIFTLFLFFNSLLFSQTLNPFPPKGEVYFQFKIENLKVLDQLTNVISIDKVDGNLVYAYANEEEFNNFLKLNYTYKQLPHPGDEKVEVSSNLQRILAWDVYPTYDAYISMMTQFQTMYPDLCKIVDAGTTPQGRKLLFAKISKNVNVREAEPQFMYASSMHGDEATGYVLMLRLIDTLLSSYSSNARIKNLIDSTEIWIQPLSNPDGTYYGGNGTVTGARRYNSAGRDLNRNFPDPAAGPHPDGYAWQPENISMMNIIEQNNFILSANFHGGAEVANYPWDTWARLHPDDTWFRWISRQFADTTHQNAPSTYFNDLDNGITNGYAWYRITGGRQDYITYFNKGREVTMEISATKLISASLLPAHWYYLRKSLFNYMEQVKYGIAGKVTSSLSGLPLKAKITVSSHDFDNSEIKTDSITGTFYRLIGPGTYTISVSADNYITKTVAGLTVQNYARTIANVQLEPTNPIPVELISFKAYVVNNKTELKWITATEKNNSGFEIFRSSEPDGKFVKIAFVPGNGTSSVLNNYNFTDEVKLTGKYYYKLFQVDYNNDRNLVGEAESIIKVNGYSLSQNYPNPFNPVSTINFSVPQSCAVTLKLYDLLGNEVKTLLNENHEAGRYSYILDAKDLSSGVYYYKLQAGTFSDTKKLLLLK